MRKNSRRAFRPYTTKKIGLLGLLIASLLLGNAWAGADGMLPKMAAPPEVPVYWQLASIEMQPEPHPSGGYDLQTNTTSLLLDLEDGLLTASVLEAEGMAQGITLTVEKHDQIVMEHSYAWTPMPIYLEPGKTYPIEVTGHRAVGTGTTPNTLLAVYEQGELIARISAGGYTGHEDSFAFDLSAGEGLYSDGSLVISFILRDVNDMYRNRIAFTYEMNHGIKPEPTPVPGFSPAELTQSVEIPSFYAAVAGQDNLWQIVTAPDEYRSYGTMTGSAPAFFPADAQGEVVMDVPPADPDADFAEHVEGFVPESPDSLPEVYTAVAGGTYTFTTRNGDTMRRAFGRVDGAEPAFYPASEDGEVDPQAEAVDPAEDYAQYVEGFGEAPLPGDIPAKYIEVKKGLYGFTGRDGQTRYRAYGRLNGAEPAFYPADETGEVAPDAEAVTPQEDFDEYIKGFDPVAVDDMPDHYARITESLFSIEDREGETLWRAHGVKDGEAPAYYPADAQGEILSEDASPIDPQDDYESFVEGFVAEDAPVDVPDYYEPTEVAGVYGFIDKDGQAQYRGYGRLNRGKAAYYPCDAQGNVLTNALPVDPASDQTLLPLPDFEPQTPAEVPTHYEQVSQDPPVYAFTDSKGMKRLRTYGAYGTNEAAFYPANEQGEPDSANPIAPQEEYEESFGAFEIAVPAEEETPAHYKPVEGTDGLYSTKDAQGNVTFRVYGALQEGETPTYYPADASGNILGGVAVDPQAEQAALNETFTAQAPAADMIPSYYTPVEGTEGLYVFRDESGEPQYRAYGAADGGQAGFVPAQADGSIADVELTDPDAEYVGLYGAFTPSEPQAVPDHYRLVDEVEGLYAFENEKGETEYRVYGAASGEETPAFHPADDEGDIVSGVTVDPQQEYDRLLAAFTLQSAAEAPAFYTPVQGQEGLYEFEDSQGETQYRVYGEMSGAEPAFYPADAQGKILSGRQASAELDERRLPMSIQYTINTPAATQEVQTTPIARVRSEGADRWTDPSAPQPTQYIATIEPAQTADATAEGIARVITAAPEPTQYAASVQPAQTQDSAAGGEVSRVFTPAPEATAEVLPADESPSTVPQTAVATAGATDAATQDASQTARAAADPAAVAPRVPQAG